MDHRIESNCKLAAAPFPSYLSTIFEDHIINMCKFYFSKFENLDLFKNGITRTYYLGLEEFIFENSHYIENEMAREINWSEIDKIKYAMRSRLKKILGKSADLDKMNRMINFSIDSLENYAIYNQMHPNSFNNPWASLYGVLMQGFIFVIGDTNHLVDIYNLNPHTSSERELGVMDRTFLDKFFKDIGLDYTLLEHTNESI